MSTDIALFIHSLEGGGAERAAVVLANEMSRKGHSIDLVVQRQTGPYTGLVDPEVRIVDLNCRLRDVPRRFRRYLREQEPQAVLSFMTGFNVIAGLIRTTRTPPRLVLCEQNEVRASPSNRPTWERLAMSVMGIAYRRADAVVAVSNHIREELLDVGIPDERLVSIPNPVPIDDVRSGSLQPAPQHPYYSSGVPVLVTAGRLVPQKDHQTLIEAAALLRKRRDFRLLVLGDGPLRDELVQMTRELGLSDVVDFVGFVAPPWPWMARADMFVLSSRYEGWPMVLSEAMALGIPIVSTDTSSGPAEILDNGRLGRLAKVGDAQGLAMAIDESLDDHPPSETLMARATEWSVERVAERYLGILGHPTGISL